MAKKVTGTPEELLTELDLGCAMLITIGMKAYAEMTGERRGSVTCPRCKTGTLRYSMAESNNHMRVICDRVVGKRGDGDSIYCVNAME